MGSQPRILIASLIMCKAKYHLALGHFWRIASECMLMASLIRWEANHLALGRMGVTVARNVATTLKQTQISEDAPCRISAVRTEAMGHNDWRMEL